MKVDSTTGTLRRIQDMPVGSIGIIRIETETRYLGKHLLRTQSGWVMLENPICEWKSPYVGTVMLEMIQLGQKVILTVEQC